MDGPKIDSSKKNPAGPIVNNDKKISEKNIRDRQDELLKLVFDDEDSSSTKANGSYVSAILVAIVVAAIIALIAYFIINTYFKDQLDNTMMLGIIILLFIVTLAITFVIAKPKPKPDEKDNLCKV